MHRFFIAPGSVAGSAFLLPDNIAHQVRDVLHLAMGEQLVLLDNSGDELLCAIVRSNRAGVEVEIRERRAGKGESPIQIILCQGMLKSARFEWILEKGTELGVATFAPVLCRRSMAGLEDAGPSKLQRWQRIIQEAAEQCGRAHLPQLTPVRPLKQALNDLSADALVLIPWEEEHKLTLQGALRARMRSAGEPLTVILFIGPEGGLLTEEVQLAQQHGAQVVTLGPRIMRAETAALAAVANIMYEYRG